MAGQRRRGRTWSREDGLVFIARRAVSTTLQQHHRETCPADAPGTGFSIMQGGRPRRARNRDFARAAMALLSVYHVSFSSRGGRDFLHDHRRTPSGNGFTSDYFIVLPTMSAHIR